MNHLRKLLWLLVCLLALPAARGQVAVISSQVIDTSGQPLPFAQVRVCSVTSTGVPCTPTAAIYQDYGLTIPAANPTTADQYGNFTVYAGVLPAPNLYTVQFSPASGITWAYVYNGPFLSAAGGTVTGFINALGYNGVPEADQCSGVDAWAKINTCAGLIPNGGVEDARGFGATIQTVTTPLTALASPTRPIELELNQATEFLLNVQFSPGSINTGVTTGVSGSAGACMAPIAAGSSIVTTGLNQPSTTGSTFRLGPNAKTYDVVCNALMDGTQESMVIDGLQIVGNQSATMAGSLLHLRKIFVSTLIQNVVTYLPFGNALTDEGGSDHLFINDNFNDSSPVGGYPGTVVTLSCVANATFVGGAIQFNGINNPLMIARGYDPLLASDCPLGTVLEGTKFYNTDIELQPATVGSFSGHATNVDPIQITDASNFVMDNLTAFGTIGAGQQHLVDIATAGSGGQVRGPVEIDNIWYSSYSAWQANGGGSLIHNTVGAPYVSPQQADVFGKQNGSIIGVGKYRWAGNGATAASEIDYLDSEIVSTLQGLSTNGDINASLESGADIGAKINAAIAQCSAKCKVFVPAGLYPFTTQINLPMSAFGLLSLTLDPGAILQYQGTSDAILTSISVVPTSAELIIQGGQLLGNASATSGIHLMPAQHITIRNMTIVEFTNGDGILNEGANVVNIYDNHITNNKNGIENISTFCNSATPVQCGSTITGSAFSPNAMHVFANAITVNSNWGVWEHWNGLSGSTGALGNIYRDNDLELNGFGGNTNFGAIFIMKSVGDVISGNYFEGSPHEVVLGQYTGGAGDFFAASGTIVRDNYFTTSPPISPLTKAYNIELENTIDVLIEGNSEQGTSGISSSTNCFINAPLGTGGVGTSSETRTIISRNAIFQNSISGSGNQICSNGVGVTSLLGVSSFNLFNANYQSYMAFQNFQVNQAVTSESIAVQNLTANGSCDIRPVASSATAAVNGRTTILGGTTYLSGLSAGSVTITHPSGQAITVDLYCANNPTGGYGVP